ncbi:MAG: hypothetical protein ACKERG_00070 [Candidatus Hodgkinia cicadicola]
MKAQLVSKSKGSGVRRLMCLRLLGISGYVEVGVSKLQAVCIWES